MSSRTINYCFGIIIGAATTSFLDPTRRAALLALAAACAALGACDEAPAAPDAAPPADVADGATAPDAAGGTPPLQDGDDLGDRLLCEASCAPGALTRRRARPVERIADSRCGGAQSGVNAHAPPRGGVLPLPVRPARRAGDRRRGGPRRLLALVGPRARAARGRPPHPRGARRLAPDGVRGHPPPAAS